MTLQSQDLIALATKVDVSIRPKLITAISLSSKQPYYVTRYT